MHCRSFRKSKSIEKPCEENWVPGQFRGRIKAELKRIQDKYSAERFAFLLNATSVLIPFDFNTTWHTSHAHLSHIIANRVPFLLKSSADYDRSRWPIRISHSHLVSEEKQWHIHRLVEENTVWISENVNKANVSTCYTTRVHAPFRLPLQREPSLAGRWKCSALMEFNSGVYNPRGHSSIPSLLGSPGCRVGHADVHGIYALFQADLPVIDECDISTKSQIYVNWMNMHSALHCQSSSCGRCGI